MAAVILAVTTPPALRAIDLNKANPFNWLKKEEASVPDTSQKQSQEAVAAGMMRDAKTAASTRELRPSFDRMWRTCNFTVSWLMSSARAMVLLLWPRDR